MLFMSAGKATACILITLLYLLMTGVRLVASMPGGEGMADRRGSGLLMTRRIVDASSSPTVLSNNDNIAYTVDITIGGQSFPVQIDTGSSDLWVHGSKADSIQLTGQPDPSIFVEIEYGSGSASGNVYFADVELGGFTASNQAFMLATTVVDEPSNLFEGILGVGFNANSQINLQIQQTLDSDSGTTSLSKILSQNNVLNSFDIQLSRLDDVGNQNKGMLFIGSHDDSFSRIADQPQLPQTSTGIWSIALDSMKVNGNSFQFDASTVLGVPSGKISTLMDSGTSFALLPPAAIDFIYQSIPGSVLHSTSSSAEYQWLVPCTGTTNVSFTYGGIDFPIHYLDLTTVSDGGGLTDVTICTNTYQYLDPDNLSGADAVMGDSFLRNVYASFNFGENGATPFMQMIPTTDFDTALPDFQNTRGQDLADLPPDIFATTTSTTSSATSEPSFPDGSQFLTSTFQSQSLVSVSNTLHTPTPSSTLSVFDPNASRSSRLSSFNKLFIPVIVCVLTSIAWL